VRTPSTFSWSSTTSKSRTPRAIMNWFAPPIGACGRIVAGSRARDRSSRDRR
jgi:hypothetical protein